MKSFHDLMNQIDDLAELSPEEIGVSLRPEYELDNSIHDMDIDLKDNGLKELKVDDLFITLRDVEETSDEVPF